MLWVIILAFFVGGTLGFLFAVLLTSRRLTEDRYLSEERHLFKESFDKESLQKSSCQSDSNQKHGQN